MAKLVNDSSMKMEKIKPKSYPQRRFSTGNAIINLSEPKPIPNYLRASIGSCHDFCKYGLKRDFPADSDSAINPKQADKNENTVLEEKSESAIHPQQDKIQNMVLEKKSETNHRGKKVSRTKNLVPAVSSRQKPKPSEVKPKPLVGSEQSAKKTSLKTTSNVRISRDDASKKTSSLPLKSPSKFSGLSVKIPTVNSGKCNNSPEKVSQLGIKSSLPLKSPSKFSGLSVKIPTVNSGKCNNSPEKVSQLGIKKSSNENIPEKIIQMIEPSDEIIRNKADLAQDCNRCTTTFCSSPTQKQKLESPKRTSPRQKQKLESPSKKSIRALTIEKVVPKKNDFSPRKVDSSPRKAKIKKEKIVQTKNPDDVFSLPNESLRRATSDGVLIYQQNVFTRGALRRQWVEQKDTNPNLMNAVIEENASDAVKMRKGKVKALVHAFETVITIQDSENSKTNSKSG